MTEVFTELQNKYMEAARIASLATNDAILARKEADQAIIIATTISNDINSSNEQKQEANDVRLSTCNLADNLEKHAEILKEVAENELKKWCIYSRTTFGPFDYEGEESEESEEEKEQLYS